MRATLDNAQRLLPLLSNKPEADWVAEEVRQLALKKQEAWVRWKKKVDSPKAQAEYHTLTS